jgi:hypothetical protein
LTDNFDNILNDFNNNKDKFDTLILQKDKEIERISKKSQLDKND